MIKVGNLVNTFQQNGQEWNVQKEIISTESV